MSALFSSPSLPPPPPPPPPSSREDEDVQAAALRERLRRSLAQGRSANILTGGRGVADPVSSARKTLLGE